MYKRPHDIPDKGLIQGINCPWPAIYFDDFSGAFNWKITGTGADYTVEPHADAAFTGSHGLRLKTKTTTPAADDEAVAAKSMFLKPPRILRVQVCAKSPDTNPKLLLKIIPCFFDGTYEYHCDIYVDFFNNRVGYLVPNNAGYAAIYPTGWQIFDALSCWNFIDLRVDTHAKTWHSLAVNSFHADLRHQTLYKSAYAYPPKLTVTIKACCKDAEQEEAYIDNLLITAEEP